MNPLPRTASHELIRLFAAHGFALCNTLCDMLDEHLLHRTERRGCGYTQATRFLADLINLPALPAARGGGLFQAAVETEAGGREGLLDDLARQAAPLRDALALPESKLLATLIFDVALRRGTMPDLGRASEAKLPIGTCPLAEQFFLEIAYERIRRGGRVNIVVGADGAPLLIEKCGLGDNHSSISVAPVRLNGVDLPLGSLIGLDRDTQGDEALPATRNGRGHLLPLASLRCVRFLRLTTLAVAPADRARAFTTHFEQQIRGELFSPASTRIEQLVHFAREQLG